MAAFGKGLGGASPELGFPSTPRPGSATIVSVGLRRVRDDVRVESRWRSKCVSFDFWSPVCSWRSAYQQRTPGPCRTILAARRARLLDKLGPEVMAIFWSAPTRVYSLDVDYEYPAGQPPPVPHRLDAGRDDSRAAARQRQEGVPVRSRAESAPRALERAHPDEGRSAGVVRHRDRLLHRGIRAVRHGALQSTGVSDAAQRGHDRVPTGSSPPCATTRRCWRCRLDRVRRRRSR